MCLALGSVNVEGVSAHAMMSCSSSFFFFVKGLSLLILSLKICTVTTDTVTAESLLLLFASIDNDLCTPPDFLHSVLPSLSLFP